MSRIWIMAMHTNILHIWDRQINMIYIYNSSQIWFLNWCLLYFTGYISIQLRITVPGKALFGGQEIPA